MTGLIFRPEAEADLSAIALHIAATSPMRAHGVVARLRSRCEMLKRHPLADRPREDLGDGLRSLSERPFVLDYPLADDDAEIVAILHGARDLPAAIAGRIDRDEP